MNKFSRTLIFLTLFILCIGNTNGMSFYNDSDTNKEKSILKQSLSLLPSIGPSVLFDAGGKLTGSAGIRFQADINDNFFTQIGIQGFLNARYESTQLVFSNNPFILSKDVNYKQKIQYNLASFQFGYYWMGWSGDLSNAYFSLGPSFVFVVNTIDVEEFDRSQYEEFETSGTENLQIVAWSLHLGYHTLINKHIGAFTELQLNIGLNAERESGAFQTYQKPQGHLIGLNFGFRFFIFPQDE